MLPEDFMPLPITRRDMLKATAAQAIVALAAGTVQAGQADPEPLPPPQPAVQPGWVIGKMSGAEALVETLIQEGTDCVFGIPGAQENELWDAMKMKGLGYL